MSDILNTPVKNAAATDPPAETPVTPTVTFHDAGAAQARLALAAIRQQIPDLRTYHPVTAKTFNGLQSVPSDFMLTVCKTADLVPQIQITLDVSKTRDNVQFEAAYLGFADDLDSLSHDVRFTCAAKHAEAAAATLRSYAIAKNLNRDKTADIATHVANMARDLGRMRPKPRVKEVPAPVPQQQPAPTTMAA